MVAPLTKTIWLTPIDPRTGPDLFQDQTNAPISRVLVPSEPPGGWTEESDFESTLTISETRAVDTSGWIRRDADV